MQSSNDRVHEAQRVVVEVARGINSSLDLRAVAETVVSAAVRVVGSNRCAIYLVSADRTMLEPLCGIDITNSDTAQQLFYSNPIAIDSLPLLQYSLLHPEPSVIEDTEDHPLSNPELFRFFDTRTVINVGLSGPDGRVFAFMPFLWTGQPHHIRDDDIFLAQSLAALAEVALSNARLFTQIERERARATAINEVAHAVNSGLTLGDTLTRAITSLVLQLHADDGSIFLMSPDGTSIVGSAETRVFDRPRIGAVLPLGRTPNIARAITEQRPLLVLPHEALGDEEQWFASLQLQAALYVPLVSQGRLVGIAFANFLQQAPQLAPDDERFTRAIADQCALAIERGQILDAASTRAAELEAIFDAITDSILIVDHSGKTLKANAAALQSNGSAVVDLTLAERITHFNIRYGDGTSVQLETSPTMRALRGEQVLSAEVVDTPAPGVERTLSVSSGPILDSTGQVRAAVTLTRDISEAVAARREKLDLVERFRRKAAELEAVIAQMGEGVIIADRDGRIVLVNSYAASLHGVDVLDVVPSGYSNAYQLYHLDDTPYPPLDLPLSRAVLYGETVTNAEWLISRPDGSKVIASGSATPIIGASGERLGAVLVVRDVTARRRLEAEKDEFLSVVSHELKTPLTTIKGLSDLVRRRIARGVDPAEVLNNLDGVTNQIRRMEALIGDLLDIRRLETGVLPLACIPLDVVPLVLEARERTQSMTERHNVAIDVPDHLQLVVNVDKGRIEQVLDNLLSNAIKYSPDGGTILLTLSSEDGQAILRIRDEGIGIPEQGRERLFERFYRGANVPASQYGGLGIGLALSKEIALRHGGSLQLETTSTRGTTFKLCLPLLQA